MNNSPYILKKYWKKHIKNAIVLMFSGVLTVAVVFSALMQFRRIFNRELHKLYDQNGMFDLMLPEASENIIEQFIDENETPEYGYIYSLGKTGKAGIGSMPYTYGYIDDPHGLLHVPFESGVMPSNDSEIAIDRGVLNEWNWVGTLGDSITLDGKTYSVVGIIDGCYGKNRAGSELWEAGIEITHPVPLIFVMHHASETQAAYKITLVGGIVDDQQECDSYGEILHAEYGGPEYGYSLQYKNLFVHDVSVMDEFRLDVRWILILSGIAVQIAVLSVFSVLRGVFIERRNFIGVLHRIGMSKKKIRNLYIIECVLFILTQIIIGTALGALGYAVLNAYQINVLGESKYSAFTSDILVTSNTPEPFVFAAIFGAVITVLAYLLTTATTVYKPREKVKRRKPRSLRASFAAVFRERGITVIQIVSLSLIGFGVMLGYMYYTRDGKEVLDYLKFDYPVSYKVGREDAFDMEKDDIAEYYTCGSPAPTSIETYDGKDEEFILADNNYKSGMDDDIVNQFTNVTAFGELAQTFVISDTDNKNYSDKVIFREPEIEALVQFSSDGYKDFFEDGNLGSKHLYRLSTKLTNTAMIEKLSEYVEDGEINISALNNGSEIIIVTDRNNSQYSVGEKLRIGSVMHNDMGGIAGIVETEIKVGAIAVIPKNSDKMLRYTVKSSGNCNMLTTAEGADANGFHNAVYTEMFTKEDIDGGLIPANCGAKLISYKELKHREFLENAVEHGGLIMLFTLMSLLGFSAYFSGIGIKIRQRSYEISALRAVGTPLKRIRAKLLADGLAIPAIAALVSGGGIFAVQKITENAYKKLSLMFTPEYFVMENSEELQAQIIEKFFLEKQIWSVSLIKPLLIILAVMCVVTVILTLISLKRFKRNIVDGLGEGRTKQ